MPLRILATGDLHIGRCASRTAGTDRFSAADTWLAVVRWAIDEGVDVVLLSGDVIDHANRFYEATGPLEKGLNQLAEAKIQTYAVAGNHDWDVLPRVADHLTTSSFSLLGRDGNWEEAIFEAEGTPLLRIIGRSFTSKHNDPNPLENFPKGREDSLPTIGLLHADLDAAESRYAPVTSRELQSKEVAFWLLGHVHAPKKIEGEVGPAILYPGSPLAFDPGETGPHGPWLVEVEGSHSVSFKQVALSPVRYETREVDLTEAESDDAFESAVQEAAATACKEIADESNCVQQLILRLRLIGASRLCGRAESLARELESNPLERNISDLTCIVDRVINETRPAIDLAALSARRDPPGLLAELLLSLDSDTPDLTDGPLFRQAHQALRDIHLKGAYGQIADDAEPSLEDVRQILQREGVQLLETLRSQVSQEGGTHE